MAKDIIHFAHANGFPAKTYKKLFSHLENDFEVKYLERIAHNPRFPVTDGWKELAAELRQEIERHYTKPVIGVGHSLGGVLHFLAAVEKPELYKRIILLDAPIISRLSSKGLQILKMTKLIDRFTPSRITEFRRNLWLSREDAYEHFLRKEMFARFDKEVLRDYVEYGTRETQKGFELFFKPSIEAKIYRTIPHHLPDFRGKLKVPTDYIGGTDSREAKLARLSFMRRNFSIDFHSIKGSHLFPLEKPYETSVVIREICGK
jgi:pimeloyl-ACP methyl ester carboxylesterase